MFDKLHEILEESSHHERRKKLVDFIKQRPSYWGRAQWSELAEALSARPERLHVAVLEAFFKHCPYENKGPEAPMQESPRYFFARRVQDECLARLALAPVREATGEDVHYILLALKAAQITRLNMTHLAGRWRAKFGTMAEDGKRQLPEVVEKQIAHHRKLMHGRKAGSPQVLEASALKAVGWEEGSRFEEGGYLTVRWRHPQEGRRGETVYRLKHCEPEPAKASLGEVVDLTEVRQAAGGRS